MEIDHIGIATGDAAGLSALLRDLFDAPIVHEEAARGLRFVFLDVGGVYIELLEPTEPDNAVARFIEDHGEGMHHVAVAVEDIPAALDRARELGIELVDEEPRPGAWGHQIAFLHPDSTGGFLVEFVSH